MLGPLTPTGGDRTPGDPPPPVQPAPLDAALAYARAGLSLIPVACDGTNGAAWAARANELAAWAWLRLVNRTDAWGEYRPAEEVGREFVRADGAKGTLGPQTTAKGHLAHARLVRHFQARGRADVVGLHLADAENLSKGGGVDIDFHGPGSTDPAVNLSAALHWYAGLAARGFVPLLYDSNGAGGFHLRVLLAEAIDAGRLFQLFKALTSDHRRLGFTNPPEQFPKQPDVRRCRMKLGNWLRLPGRHHTRDFWSRVWNGGQWLDGPAAVEYLLRLRGDAPGLAPNVPTPTPNRRRPPRPCGQTGGLSARIAAYLRRLPNLGEGQGRDDVAFGFAAWLVRDLGLDDGAALDWLDRWDGGNNPPKGRGRLAEIVKNARAYGRSPIGCGIDPAARGGVSIAPGGRPGHYVLRATAEIP